MLVAERVDAGLLFRVLGLKVLVALITGVLADLAIRALRKNARVHAFVRRTVFSVRRDGMEADVVDQLAEGGETAEHICRLCELDRCGCSHDHAAVPGGRAGLRAAHGRPAHVCRRGVPGAVPYQPPPARERRDRGWTVLGCMRLGSGVRSAWDVRRRLVRL